MSISRLIGLDNHAREYAFERDAELGYTSHKRVAEKWVKTTCGYCSVGCGIEIGVRDAGSTGQRVAGLQ